MRKMLTAFRQCIAPNWTRIGISGPIKASAMPMVAGKTPLPAPGRDGRLNDSASI